MTLLALLFAVAIHITPQELVWRAAPPPYPAGVDIAVLESAPREGQMTVRLRLPNGTKLTQSSRVRNGSVTVLSGNVTIDHDAFGPGAFFVAGVFDGDLTATEESIIQVTSEGAWLKAQPPMMPGAESAVPLRSDDAELTLIDATPASYADVTNATTIKVRVHYAVKDFKAGDYNLSPMFESTRTGVTVSAPVKAPAGTVPAPPYPLTAASGDMTIEVPVGELLARATVAKPLHMWIYLLRKTGEHSSRPLVRTVTVTYNVK
jgi:hypothetical protein